MTSPQLESLKLLGLPMVEIAEIDNDSGDNVLTNDVDFEDGNFMDIFDSLKYNFMNKVFSLIRFW